MGLHVRTGTEDNLWNAGRAPPRSSTVQADRAARAHLASELGRPIATAEQAREDLPASAPSTTRVEETLAEERLRAQRAGPPAGPPAQGRLIRHGRRRLQSPQLFCSPDTTRSIRNAPVRSCRWPARWPSPLALSAPAAAHGLDRPARPPDRARTLPAARCRCHRPHPRPNSCRPRTVGQPMVVDNKPGAGGAIAVQAMNLSQPADGHDAGGGTPQQRPDRDPARASRTAFDPHQGRQAGGRDGALGACSSSRRRVSRPSRCQGSVVAYVKAQPGRGLASPPTAQGTSSHYASAIFNDKAGLDLQHVPFAGLARPRLAAGDGQPDSA
jgi:hypothetical protein